MPSLNVSEDAKTTNEHLLIYVMCPRNPVILDATYASIQMMAFVVGKISTML